MRPRLQGIEAGHPVRALAGAEFLVDAERDIDQVQRLVDTALLVDHCRAVGQRRRRRQRKAAKIAQGDDQRAARRSEEHTSELQSLMSITYAVFCLKQKIYTTVN